MYSVHPRQLIGLDELLDLFNPPTVLVLEYDMDGVDPLLVFQSLSFIFNCLLLHITKGKNYTMWIAFHYDDHCFLIIIDLFQKSIIEEIFGNNLPMPNSVSLYAFSGVDYTA